MDHGKVGEGLDNPILLARQVSHLQQYLEEMKGVNLVEIFGLKTTLELTLEEREVMRDQYEDRLKAVVGRWVIFKWNNEDYSDYPIIMDLFPTTGWKTLDPSCIRWLRRISKLRKS